MKRTLLLAALLSLCGPVHSQAWPSKPIRFVVSFPPGGSSDLVARLISPRLSERLGQQLIIENRPGAGGNIGIDQVAKAAPDGYTIGLAAAGALSVNPSLYTSMPFDPEKDLAPVTLLAMIPFVLVTNSAQPVPDLKHLLAAAKAKPGTIMIGHGGNGSAMHLSGELLKMMAGLDMVSVPYKGSGPVSAAVLGEQIAAGVVDIPSAIANIRDGRLRALAVTTDRRISSLPNVPTFAEAGVPGYESIGWFGMVAPAGTPKAIIDRLNAETVAALNDPEIAKRAIAAGAEPLTDTPQEFAAFIHSEARKWAQVIKTANVRIN
jgi:tripartite-type tricarboxylate transporter receptor subunit TctC